jgi:hypothetical protein
MRRQMIYHCIHQNFKHRSVMVCISSAGEHMMPFVVCSQVNDIVERRLETEGFRMCLDWILKRRSKPYMNSQLFIEDISTILLPDIDELRLNEEFGNKETVLLMDNCSIHVWPGTLQLLADDQAKVISFSLTMINIFQNLDLSLFGNFKKKMNSGKASIGEW